jgi:hypothetical protein
MEPLILDNLLPESFVKEIEFTLTNTEFDWHYRSSISYGGDSVVDQFIKNDPNITETGAFVHRFFYEKQKLSQYCDFIRPILYFAEPYVSINTILRMRGVFVPRDLSLKEKYNVPHVDMGAAHKTLIYYVNDADGGTIIFNEKYDPSLGDAVNTDQKTIKTVVEAKRGRVVIFDGYHYHTGMIPTEKDKILININFS